MNRVKITNSEIEDEEFDREMTKLEEVPNTTPGQALTELENATTSRAVQTAPDRVKMTLEDAQKKVVQLNAEWTASVTAHEVKNQEMVKHQEVTGKLHAALPEDTRALLAEERSKSFEPMVNQRYMCLVDAYKKLEALTSFVVDVKTEQLKTYNDVLEKMRDDANACPNCLCKKHFETT